MRDLDLDHLLTAFCVIESARKWKKRVVTNYVCQLSLLESHSSDLIIIIAVITIIIIVIIIAADERRRTTKRIIVSVSCLPTQQKPIHRI